MPPTSPTHITLPVTRAPWMILGILGAVAAVIILLPVVVFIYMVAMHEQLTVGIFISTGLAWFIGAYLVRMVLWNSVGSEDYAITHEHITYRANFKYFQGKPILVPRVDLQVDFIIVDEEENKGVLVLKGGGVEVRSVVKMDVLEGEGFRRQLAVGSGSTQLAGGRGSRQSAVL